MLFRARDFKNAQGECASPQAAADIANRKIEGLFKTYSDDSLGTVEKYEKLDKAFEDLLKNNFFPGKFYFEHLGHMKGPVEFVANTEVHFFAELQKHLLSSEIDYVFHPEVNRGEVFVGGFRSVGVFTRSCLNGQAD